MLLSRELLEVAKARLREQETRNEANLRRAISDLYYAMFHAICEGVVTPLAGDDGNPAVKTAFLELYRAPDHASIEKRCRDVVQQKRFGEPILQFSRHYSGMKAKRENADYHPLMTYSISEVRNDCDMTETHLEGLWGCDPVERTRFSLFVGLKLTRRERQGG